MPRSSASQFHNAAQAPSVVGSGEMNDGKSAVEIETLKKYNKNVEIRT